MLRENLKRRESIGPNKPVHWSAYDVKVAFFQETPPSRNVIHRRVWRDRNANSSDLKDSSDDWTEDQEDQARNKARKFNKQPQPIYMVDSGVPHALMGESSFSLQGNLFDRR